MIVLDAEKQVLGRLASKAAKQALCGEDIVILNAEKAYVSGSPKMVLEENLELYSIKNKGNFNAGPYHPKRPDTYVRRAVRGMLPWKKIRGREAYKKVRVYIGTPEMEMKKLNIPQPKKEDQVEIKKLRRKITVGELCKSLGGKW